MSVMRPANDETSEKHSGVSAMGETSDVSGRASSRMLLRRVLGQQAFLPDAEGVVGQTWEVILLIEIPSNVCLHIQHP